MQQYLSWRQLLDEAMAAPSVHVVWLTIILATSGNGEIYDGYSPFLDSEVDENDPPALGEAAMVSRDDQGFECPSPNVITTRYRCKVRDHWTDCLRSNCCPGYTHVAGRCISDTESPCSLGLCEQKCSVYFGRVICTCFSGFKYNQTLHKIAASASVDDPNADAKACEDVDECLDNNGGCQQICENTLGSYDCKCKDGFTLGTNNHTCENTRQELAAAGHRQPVILEQALEGHCPANCHTVETLRKTVSGLTEKVRGLSTALKLYSFASGPPGPPGPVGPEGPVGPRGFPGLQSVQQLPPADDPMPGSGVATTSEEDEDEDEAGLLDSYRVMKRKKRGRQFCRCKRGATGYPGSVGPQGPRGEAGARGPKGDPGSFDFLMLMMSDIRSDIRDIQRKVFPDQNLPPSYNLRQHLAWEKRMRERDRRTRN